MFTIITTEGDEIYSFLGIIVSFQADAPSMMFGRAIRHDNIQLKKLKQLVISEKCYKYTEHLIDIQDRFLSAASSQSPVHAPATGRDRLVWRRCC